MMGAVESFPSDNAETGVPENQEGMQERAADVYWRCEDIAVLEGPKE